MPTTPNNEAAIARIGQTAYSKGSGVSELALASEAVSNAIGDDGLNPAEVESIIYSIVCRQ